jgi:hypothetical protein
MAGLSVTRAVDAGKIGMEAPSLAAQNAANLSAEVSALDDDAFDAVVDAGKVCAQFSLKLRKCAKLSYACGGIDDPGAPEARNPLIARESHDVPSSHVHEQRCLRGLSIVVRPRYDAEAVAHDAAGAVPA